MAKRIYKVNTPEPGIALVRANGPRQAVAHVVGNFFQASVATQEDLVKLIKDGVTVEEAGEEPDGQQPLLGGGEAPDDGTTGQVQGPGSSKD